MAYDPNKIREELVKREKEKGKNKDPRFLNYFDLDFGQTMTVRLMPDGGNTDELWLEYATHGKGFKNSKIGSISCANTSSDERCPACGYSFEFHEAGDKVNAKKWRRKEVAVAQCMVIDSPIEINQSEDGNLIKLMYLPWGMKESIKESIMNGTIEDATAFDFVIKKTKNPGGYADYGKSYFKVKETDIPMEIIESLDGGASFLYDLSKELPEPATAAQVDEWLKEAKRILNGMVDDDMTSGVDGVSSTDDDQSGPSSATTEDTQPEKKGSAKDLIARLNKRN